MVFEYKKLRGRIIEKYGSLGKFAEVLGISLNTMSRKMTGKRGFSQKDIIKWSGLLDIETAEYPDYFFA